MIERFNFYDVYGYLIPGFVWLLLLALPFHLTFQFHAFSAAELTAALVIAYIVGHVLSGVARQALPSAKYDIGGEKVQRSIAVLSPGYSGDGAVPPALKKELARCFEARFKFNPLEPFDVKAVEQMFYLCRASLSHAKLGAYVEQYQGMTTLTRSVGFGSCVAAIYYAAWIISSALAHVALGGHTVWPILTLAIGIVFVDGVSGALARGRYAPPRIDFSPVECLALIVVLVVVGSLSGFRHPLTSIQATALAISATLLWLAALRLQAASHAFDGSLVLGTYRDFVVLGTAKPDSSAKPKATPE